MFQLPVVLWGNAKGRRKKSAALRPCPTSGHDDQKIQGGCIPFQSAKRGSRPRRANWGCRKTERPRRGGVPDCCICTRRICHASPARGVFQTADGLGCIAPRYRLWRIPQGLPLKSVGGREQVSLSTALSLRPDCQHRVKGCVDRSGSLSLIPP